MVQPSHVLVLHCSSMLLSACDRYLAVLYLNCCRHYDWGLRAIKSVLVVAGSLLRAQEGQVESDVLYRALRDFNIPKILSQDMIIFTGLLQDLFPAVDPPRKRDMDFEKVLPHISALATLYRISMLVQIAFAKEVPIECGISQHAKYYTCLACLDLCLSASGHCGNSAQDGPHS